MANAVKIRLSKLKNTMNKPTNLIVILNQPSISFVTVDCHIL